MRDEIVTRAKTPGFILGEKTIENAMPLKSLQGNDEAEYYDDYKIKGYKIDSITDQHKAVPPVVSVTSINHNETKILILQLSTMLHLKIQVKQHIIDGG